MAPVSPATLDSLRGLTEPNRKVDFAIAVDMGYFTETDPSGVTHWHNETGQRIRRVPFFTERIDDAMIISDSLHLEVGAVAWQGSQFMAQFEGGDIAIGPSPAIAVCIAALETAKA